MKLPPWPRSWGWAVSACWLGRDACGRGAGCGGGPHPRAWGGGAAVEGQVRACTSILLEDPRRRTRSRKHDRSYHCSGFRVRACLHNLSHTHGAQPAYAWACSCMHARNTTHAGTMRSVRSGWATQQRPQGRCWMRVLPSRVVQRHRGQQQNGGCACREGRRRARATTHGTPASAPTSAGSIHSQARGQGVTQSKSWAMPCTAAPGSGATRTTPIRTTPVCTSTCRPPRSTAEQGSSTPEGRGASKLVCMSLSPTGAVASSVPWLCHSPFHDRPPLPKHEGKHCGMTCVHTQIPWLHSPPPPPADEPNARAAPREEEEEEVEACGAGRAPSLDLRQLASRWGAQARRCTQGAGCPKCTQGAGCPSCPAGGSWPSASGCSRPQGCNRVFFKHSSWWGASRVLSMAPGGHLCSSSSP